MKLGALLAHAREHCTYWAARLPPDAAAHPDAALAALAPLSRDTLRRERARLTASTGDVAQWRIARTTGTTGEPVAIVLDAAARAAEHRTLARLLERRIGASWRRADLVHLVMHAGATSRAMRSPFDPSAAAVKWNLVRLWRHPDAVFTDRLRRLDGAVVTTLPSLAELLVRRLRRAVAAPRPAAVVLSGECVDHALVASITDTLRCPVIAAYTLTEAGIVAAGCAEAGTYHVEDDAVHLEIVDGEVVVTPLDNRAMPLLRYRTGDRGAWQPACGCGNASPRFSVETGRRPARLLRAGGASAPVVRFSKLLAELDVDRIVLEEGPDADVVVRYDAPAALPAEARVLVSAVVRGALGPETSIAFRRDGARTTAGGEPTDGPPRADDGLDGTRVDTVAAWLRRRLAGDPDVHAAVITGSALDPSATTRDSDVDVVALVENPADPRWLRLAREVTGHVAGVALHVDRAADLARRAPLLACRLRMEQWPIVGRVDDALVPWPTRDDLVAAARVHLQDAAATLWQRLIAPAGTADPLNDARLAAKSALDALRYRRLVDGERETAACVVMRAAPPAPWVEGIRDAWDAARELAAPRVDADRSAWLGAALDCVRDVQARVG